MSSITTAPEKAVSDKQAVTSITGSVAVLEAFVEEGVDTIFGYPGGAIMPIYDALYDYQEKLNHILVRHEQGAVHAAEGYARSSGKVGVVLVTSGPGATNAVTGLTDALMDSIPIVCLTGQVPTHLIGNDAFQECLQRAKRRGPSRRPGLQAQDQEARRLVAFPIKDVELVVPDRGNACRPATHRIRERDMGFL